MKGKILVFISLLVIGGLAWAYVENDGFFDIRQIKGQSMEPTLHSSKQILVEKLSKNWQTLKRGDVVAYYPPTTTVNSDIISKIIRSLHMSGWIYGPEDGVETVYIHRVIGMPGEQVEIRPGEGVWVNNQKLDEPYISEEAESCTLSLAEEVCGPVPIPQDSIFLLGDNRNQSHDSRFAGFTSVSRVIGRVIQ